MTNNGISGRKINLKSEHAFAVVKSDTDVSQFRDSAGNIIAAQLYVGGVGDVKVMTIGGEVVTFTAVPAGTLLPILVQQVYSTGTTATLIIAMW